MKNLDVIFDSVSLRYNDFPALKDITFSLASGQTYGLVGRNGAGKTSLLSLLASYRLATSGKILVGDEEPFENSRTMPYITFIHETDYSDESDSAMEYFKLAQRYRPNFDLDYAVELAARFKLPMDKPIAKLSSGKQSVFNVILGFASRSPVTIFDEPYQGMDAPTRELFYKEVLEEQQRHPRTMILSTHLVSEMEYLFDHVLILDEGTLLVNEPYDELISRGLSITGEAELVDEFAEGLRILNTKQLGNTKLVTVYGELSHEQLKKAQELGLETGNVPLQDLFIYLTDREAE